jgi:outer membrane protein OmpA-like peptidoglycan-associated protein
MKKLLTSILVLLITFSVQAQLHGNKWRFGLSMGTTNYVGDIRPMPLREFKNLNKLYNRNETYSEQFSYQASLEYALGNSVGLMLTTGSYQFGSGDRFVQNDGTLLIESPSFDRALNFQTDLYDAGLSLVIKPDNNLLLSGKSFFAPYVTIGIGVQTFSVSGDLLDANGNRYDYTNQNTIPDGKFETSLNSLGTERTDGYNRTTLYANLGLGVRFRITKSIELFAQSDFKRAATDYLDDVSGEYRISYDNDFQEYAAKPGTNFVSAENPNRGFNDGNVDWYIYHGIGIKFSFGANKQAFKPPVITQRYTYVPNELTQNQLQPKEISTPAQTTNNYFTVIQLPGSETKGGSKAPLDSIQQAKNQQLIDSLSLQEKVLISDLEVAEIELNSINQAMDLAKNDTSVAESIQATRFEVMESEKSMTQGKITSLNSLRTENKFKLDSLMQESNHLAFTGTSIDTAGVMGELIIYPGQVSRILYSSKLKTGIQLDSINQMNTINQSTNSSTSSESVSREEFELAMEKFRSEMLLSQAIRDSAMIMALSRRSPIELESSNAKTVKSEPQEIKITQKETDSKDKNNELLKDALLIGGTAAATAALTSDKKEKEVPADSTKMEPKQDLDVSDSTSANYSTTAVVPILTQPEIRIDTVYRTDTLFVENEIQVLMSQAKIEVYFETNKATLSESEIEKLAPIKGLLDRNPDKFLELVGFADNTGSISYNLSLSEKRVESVKKILIETYQIPAERIKKGDGGLIVRGKSKGAEDKDRKVEIRIINE